MHERSLGSKADPAFWELTGAWRAQTTTNSRSRRDWHFFDQTRLEQTFIHHHSD
jgi:hypothetical protein